MGRINIQFLLTMRMPNGIPPGIKAELFEKVQKRMDSKKYAPVKEKANINYLLIQNYSNAAQQLLQTGFYLNRF